MLQIQIILMPLKWDHNEIKGGRETDEDRGGQRGNKLREEQEKDRDDLIKQ